MRRPDYYFELGGLIHTPQRPTSNPLPLTNYEADEMTEANGHSYRNCILTNHHDFIWCV